MSWFHPRIRIKLPASSYLRHLFHLAWVGPGKAGSTRLPKWWIVSKNHPCGTLLKFSDPTRKRNVKISNSRAALLCLLPLCKINFLCCIMQKGKWLPSADHLPVTLSVFCFPHFFLIFSSFIFFQQKKRGVSCRNRNFHLSFLQWKVGNFSWLFNSYTIFIVLCDLQIISGQFESNKAVKCI